MDIAPELLRSLDERTTAAAAALGDSVRVDIERFLTEAVHARLRARPHFLARTPPQALVAFRDELARVSASFSDSVAPMLRDLRIFYGAAPQTEAVELDALTGVLKRVEEVARELLLIWAMPGDDKPDDPDDSSVDLAPTYRVEYTPSTPVTWAWRRLRGVDTARFQLTDAAGPEIPHTLEIALHLPEVLPPIRD